MFTQSNYYKNGNHAMHTNETLVREGGARLRASTALAGNPDTNIKKEYTYRVAPTDSFNMDPRPAKMETNYLNGRTPICTVLKYKDQNDKWVTEVTHKDFAFRTGDSLYLRGNMPEVAATMEKMPIKAQVAFKKLLGQIFEATKHLK
jgi:hypothetical protein